MKAIHKNPTFYYVLVPIAVALWPLIVGGVYLQDAERNRDDEEKDYRRGRSKVDEILTIDGDRLDFAGSKNGGTEFEYYKAVGKAAELCEISPASYQLNSKPIVIREGRKSRNCHVILKDVDIATFARFLSRIQLQWAKLECVGATLTKKKGMPDTWKVDLDFKYYY